MVQRKVQSKLGIQADPNVKFEKRLVNLKRPSSQFQDGKTRGGTDLKKKKMKKSRSTKLSDIEKLRSSSSLSPPPPPPLRKNVPQPRKSPLLNVQNIAAAAAVPQKQRMTRVTDGSAPNYMKPTSCSDARKEQSQVSARTSTVKISDSKSQNQRDISNVKLSSGSNNKLARTSSMKLMRTLIKSPSFKPARASARKKSRVVVFEDVNVQKATCSSTLKDSKFPKYLMISPGGTEAEGTSVMKVCPYTYCSLNGHHHSPVTPLKSFLSARRRSLKTQKMVKLAPLSPRTAKPAKDTKETTQKQVGMDFFVEIYAKVKEEDAVTVVENIPEEDITNSFPEEQKDALLEDEYQPVSDQEETVTRSCSSESDFDEHSSIEADYANSEATDMDWEEGQFPLAMLDDKEAFGSDAGISCVQDGDMHDKLVINSDAIVSNCNDIIRGYYEALKEFFEEKTPSCEIQIDNDGAKHNFEIQESEGLSYDQFSYTEDSFEEDSDLSETEIEISSSSMDEPVEDLTATDEVVEEHTGAFEAEDQKLDSHHVDVKSNTCNEQTRNEVQEDVTTMSTAYQDMNKTDEAETNGESNGSAEKDKSKTDHNSAIIVSGNHMEEAEEVHDTKSSADYKVGDNEDTVEDGNLGQDIVDDSNYVDTKDNLADGQYKNSANAENHSISEDQSETKKHKISCFPELGEDQSDIKLKHISLAKNRVEKNDDKEVVDTAQPDAAETLLMTSNNNSPGLKRKFYQQESNSDEQVLYTNRGWKIHCRRTIKDEEEQLKYSQREPNYLPLVPGPEAEKVDLRHQMMDEKKNAEEWMLDFAIQQAVTKLAPARKKKVALLVEAFEKVMPAPKYEPRLKNHSAAFSNARPMQACS